jgi:hypothetical protein
VRPREGIISATAAAPNIAAAITYSPPAKLFVISRASPTSDGPTKPPTQKEHAGAEPVCGIADPWPRFIWSAAKRC